MDWTNLAEKVIEGYVIREEEAREILTVRDHEVLALVHGAYQIRRHFYGKKVKLNLIINAKSGLCPEDCGYCAQSIKAATKIDRYPLVSKQTIVEGAKEAKKNKIGTYCIVMSGRRPTNREVDTVIAAVEEIKRDVEQLKICACLGLVTEEQAFKLKAAGVDRFNHNINTSANHHANITTTHGYEDRVNTIENVKKAGISPCSGVICGMGETDKDIIDMTFALKDLDADSIPVNFLHPVKGTKLENMDELTPIRCLKNLSLFRFINPTKEIRIAGGREYHLRSLQNLGLFIANSIFIGDYLTTEGQDAKEDYQLIEDLGFEIEENPFETEGQQFTLYHS
ncbi:MULTISPECIES: biotin synthase BioB [Heyndrickxia]|uniref:biotin synthase BioB n=1 Tax=Heyndrickxia TaxID=2837504 RepID=UPI0014598AC9|nr:biotin synthase BioB [Weizmannia sp. CD-2023]MCI1575102.1 biotin synthase BioB [Heyndrickxia coagulans]MED4838816.1 biotin synthase BioB [Weizmannia sp. CD-2023]MED4892559.1 biotin synthase BioB [Weizmannia sp. CD-2023]MED4900531.1 biotin synthase BioB [Weizmannia sp. CD-2023]NMH82770.1 biotin synthase BioB [Heyndrickxia coagulans]